MNGLRQTLPARLSPKDMIKKESLCYLFIIFLVGCFAGWVYEEIFYWISEGVLRNRGVLYGPWLPIYGVGTLAIYCMKPLKKNPFLLFFLCTASSGVVEYVIGLVGVRFMGMRLWDYRGMFLNLNGIVCLRSVVSFGILGLIFHYLLEPITEKAAEKARIGTLYAVCLCLAVLFLADCVLSALFRTPITY